MSYGSEINVKLKIEIVFAHDEEVTSASLIFVWRIGREEAGEEVGSQLEGCAGEPSYYSCPLSVLSKSTLATFFFIPSPPPPPQFFHPFSSFLHHAASL